jgi:hypothetical protein
MRYLLPMLICTALATPSVWAGDIRTQPVQFERGSTSAVVEGKIKGYETVDYVLGAKAGQSMNVSMATDNGANYFNILAPGEDEVAMFKAMSALSVVACYPYDS